MRNMPKKTFTAEQIISKLREAEVLISQWQTVYAVCKVIGVTDYDYISSTLRHTLKENRIDVGTALTPRCCNRSWRQPEPGDLRA
jgi:hypothetical protein